jgi:hypothetical protein
MVSDPVTIEGSGDIICISKLIRDELSNRHTTTVSPLSALPDDRITIRQT